MTVGDLNIQHGSPRPLCLLNMHDLHCQSPILSSDPQDWAKKPEDSHDQTESQFKSEVSLTTTTLFAPAGLLLVTLTFAFSLVSKINYIKLACLEITCRNELIKFLFEEYFMVPNYFSKFNSQSFNHLTHNSQHAQKLQPPFYLPSKVQFLSDIHNPCPL